jgi:triphosphoribosyl-dephospho-CoA synthase
MIPFNQRWSISEAASLATALEASAPKVGNVHPRASFSDMHFGHFLASSLVAGRTFAKSGRLSVGELVLSAIQTTQACVGCNTNLGTILLLAPVAVAASRLELAGEPHCSTAQAARGSFDLEELQDSVAQTLGQLTEQDSQLVYQAIRTAQPAGMGKQHSNDISQAAPADLIAAMRQVAAMDAVARQYVNQFSDIFDTLLPWFNTELLECDCPLDAILWLQLRCLAWQPDGLIVRKCGITEAENVQMMAQTILAARGSQPQASTAADIQRLDTFLRHEGHRRNPGTTADLIAACLFCRLICGSAD